MNDALESKSYEMYCYDSAMWSKAVSRSYRIDSIGSDVQTFDDALVLPLRIIPGTPAMFGDGLLEGGVCDEGGSYWLGSFAPYTSKRPTAAAYVATELISKRSSIGMRR